MAHSETVKRIRSQLPAALQSIISDDALEQYPCGSPQGVETKRITTILNGSEFERLWTGPIGSATQADACRLGLWLLVGELDRAHRICQDIDQPEGSWWHAIVHRLEGDFWNSRYWYRRVGPHPAWSIVAELARDADLRPRSSVDSLVDLAEQGGCGSPNSEEYHSWSLCEWAGLFYYCYEQAEK